MKGALNANAQAVLDVIRNTPGHPTAIDIYEAVKVIRPRIGLASIYRILQMLVANGQIRELRHNDNTCHYEARIERHDHAICKLCRALRDVPVGLEVPPKFLEIA